MTTTIILEVFALIYYLFSTFLCAIYVEEGMYKKNLYIRLLYVVGILTIAPIATPIILGIYFGFKLKE